MSEFSERCKQLLLESGGNVYQFAKHSGLDRTSIQRMITGKRLPSPQFVEDFCANLRINPVEEEELLKLYIIEKIGKTAYHSRYYVKNIIEGIAGTFHNPQPYPLDDKVTRTSAGGDLFQNENEIYKILLDELKESESSEISLYVPITYRFLFDILQRLFHNTAKQVKITHLLALNKNPSGSSHCTYNLEILYQLLPVFKNLGSRYTALYFYNKQTPGDEKFMIMPYFILTAKHVVVISSDLNTHILLNNPDIIQSYRREYERVLAYARPLVSCAFSANGLEGRLSESDHNYGKPSHTLKYCPDLMHHNFMQKNKADKFNTYIISERFSVSPYLNIELHDTHCLHLYFSFPDKQVVCFSIDESSICEAFYDFFESLPDTGLVCNKKETSSI